MIFHLAVITDSGEDGRYTIGWDDGMYAGSTPEEAMKESETGRVYALWRIYSNDSGLGGHVPNDKVADLCTGDVRLHSSDIRLVIKSTDGRILPIRGTNNEDDAHVEIDFKPYVRSS